MRVFVKICGLTDAASVAAAVEAGADAVGFVFAASPRKVDPETAHEITRDVPASVQRVAVMRHPSNDRWQHVLDVFQPDVLQTDIEDFAALDVPADVRRWPVIREGDQVADWPDEFVYEGKRSGAGETVDWPQAAEIAHNGCMVLAGGLDCGNVARAIAAVKPWGVDVSSGVESEPGKKDPELIRKFINAVRAAETTE